MLTPETQRDYERTVRNYERKVLSTYLFKETKLDRTIRADMRDMWVRLCDTGLVFIRKTTGMVHRTRVRRPDNG